MSSKPTGGRPGAKVHRAVRLQWIQLGQVEINPRAQREFKQAWANELARDFDPEQIGFPTVNLREGTHFCVDGQHRIAAYKQWSGEGWETQQLQFQTYEGLTEEQEAELFLKLNNKLSVSTFDRFRVGVNAGRAAEAEVDRIVGKCQLRIARTGSGAISAVGALMRVYERSGGDTLARTLSILRDAYGDAGLGSKEIDGIGLLCHRYNGDLDDGYLVQRLSRANGGLNGLLGKAGHLREQTGNPLTHCIAAAAVAINNTGRGGKKLPSWWRTSD